MLLATNDLKALHSKRENIEKIFLMHGLLQRREAKENPIKTRTTLRRNARRQQERSSSTLVDGVHEDYEAPSKAELNNNYVLYEDDYEDKKMEEDAFCVILKH